LGLNVNPTGVVTVRPPAPAATAVEETVKKEAVEIAKASGEEIIAEASAPVVAPDVKA